MADNRLQLVSESISSPEAPPSMRYVRRQEQQAKFERLWLREPERFNPLRNCMQKERLERTWNIIPADYSLTDKRAVDLGCGAGFFTRRLRDAGASVDAVDIAENALKYFALYDNIRIHTRQDAVPTTKLDDDEYDLVVCTELIAELPPDDYRLCFAELSRLIKRNGYLVCSSPIDINSEGGAQRLLQLAQTEFDILEIRPSYHALYLRLKRLLKTPSRFIEAWRNPQYCNRELDKRTGLDYVWFWFNTTLFMIWIWSILNTICRPLLKLLKYNRSVLLTLEKICHYFSDEAGISHLIFLAKRRPLQAVEPSKRPVERPGKREIWE